MNFEEKIDGEKKCVMAYVKYSGVCRLHRSIMMCVLCLVNINREIKIPCSTDKSSIQ